MHPSELSSAVFLFYVLVLLPVGALRTAKVFNAPQPPEGEPPRRALPGFSRLMANTLVMLGMLFGLAWYAARTFNYRIFAVPACGARELLAGVGALVMLMGLVFASRAIRTQEEIQSMAVNRLMPTAPREAVLYSLVAIAAGVSEEAAYRGVLVIVLWHTLGNVWMAVLIAAAAFAIAHALQGWKSGVVIFIVALMMHALAWFTGTLVISMGVHAIYDLVAPAIMRVGQHDADFG